MWMWNGRVFHFVFIKNAEMAELVDAPASKAGIRKDVWVRVPLSVQKWRYGVTASSLGSYPCGPGSIPGIATKK